MVSGIIGNERVRQALMPTDEERMQRTIAELERKLAAAQAALKAGPATPTAAHTIPPARGAPSRGARLVTVGRV